MSFALGGGRAAQWCLLPALAFEPLANVIAGIGPAVVERRPRRFRAGSQVIVHLADKAPERRVQGLNKLPGDAVLVHVSAPWNECRRDKDSDDDCERSVDG